MTYRLHLGHHFPCHSERSKESLNILFVYRLPFTAYRFPCHSERKRRISKYLKRILIPPHPNPLSSFHSETLRFPQGRGYYILLLSTVYRFPSTELHARFPLYVPLRFFVVCLRQTPQNDNRNPFFNRLPSSVYRPFSSSTVYRFPSVDLLVILSEVKNLKCIIIPPSP